MLSDVACDCEDAGKWTDPRLPVPCRIVSEETCFKRAHEVVLAE